MGQKVVVSDKDFLVEFENQEKTKGTLNKEPFEIDVAWVSDRKMNVIWNFKTYEIELLPDDNGNRQLKINGNSYGAKTVGKLDDLLKKMGMQNGSAGKITSVKAPMPGLVLSLNVQPDTEVKKGDRLLVLEAMKMENVIKSPTDGKIQSVEVCIGQTVDKNQALVKFT